MAVVAGLAFLCALVALIVVSLRYQAEKREAARVHALFLRYVSPPVVEELLRRKDPRLYTGRSLRATIVVCRIWNFAGFAETLTAEETLRYLNEFFALAGTSIQKHGGIIDKFLPDGIIGVFGVPLGTPVADPLAEEHALRASLDIVRFVDAMDRRWNAQGRRAFQVGIGISSGDVIAGDAGFNERREFTVVGPEALLAARLQETTAGLKAPIVATTATCKPVLEMFELLPLSGHPLPGLRRLADAYIVLGLAKETGSLVLPAAGVFMETMVEASVPTVPGPSSPRVTPAAPDVAPLPVVERADPQAPMRPRRRAPEGGADTAFAVPESRPSRYGEAADDRPIFPEPPAPVARLSAYEDRDGPPIALPP